MNSLSEKTSAADSIIERALVGSEMPYAAVSFGKDSTVLLDLLSKHNVHNVFYIPHSDDEVDQRNREILTERYQLTVELLPTGRQFLYFVPDGGVQTLNLVPFGHRVVAPVYGEIHEDGAPTHCVDDEMRADRGAFSDTDPDLIFWGTKYADFGVEHACTPFLSSLSQSEQDQIKAGLSGDFTTLGVRSLSPLFDWTSDDVWDYIERFDLPYSHIMYEDRKRRLPSVSTCFRCHNPRLPIKVHCPKIGKEIFNSGCVTHAVGSVVLEEVLNTLKEVRLNA